ILAFGDGFATLVGRNFRVGALPWNRDKSWGGFIAFLLAGTASGAAIAIWMGGPQLDQVIVAVIAGAIAESLATGVDDNLTVPFASAVTLAVLSIAPESIYSLPPRAQLWLAIHTALAIVGYLLR